MDALTFHLNYIYNCKIFPFVPSKTQRLVLILMVAEARHAMWLIEQPSGSLDVLPFHPRLDFFFNAVVYALWTHMMWKCRIFRYKKLSLLKSYSWGIQKWVLDATLWGWMPKTNCCLEQLWRYYLETSSCPRFDGVTLLHHECEIQTNHFELYLYMLILRTWDPWQKKLVEKGLCKQHAPVSTLTVISGQHFTSTR